MGKKCGIITFNHAVNYGAVFQMLALQRSIENIGVECEVIDYQPEFMVDLYKKRVLIDWIHPRTLYHTFFNNNYIRYNISGFNNFIRNNIKMSEKVYRDTVSLLETNNIYDNFIAGSDQVFNLYCSNFDENYFLKFVVDANKRNSYAASLGLDSIPDELKNLYIELLDGVNYLSIREKTGAEVIEKLIERNCEVNVDPTLLLSKKEWFALSDKYVPDREYVLVYVLSEDKILFKFARELAKRNKCELYYINDRFLARPGMKNLRKVNPERWLSLFFNASAIITNSFHGVVFSVNFEKKFYPFLLNKNTRVNSRIRDFLKLVKLEYLLENYCLEKNIEKFSINFIDCRLILDKEKNKSVKYLEKVLKNE